MVLMSPLRSACSMRGVAATACSGRSTTAAPISRSPRRQRRNAIRAVMHRVWQAALAFAGCKTWNITHPPPLSAAVQAGRRIERAMGAQPVHADGDGGVLSELRQQVRATPPLKSGEVDELVERAALGDRASRDRLVAANLATVIRLAEARA